MRSRVLEHQQLAVRLLREQELWGRVTMSRSWGDRRGPTVPGCSGQGLQRQPISQRKKQRPKVTRGLEWGLAVQSPSMSEDCGQTAWSLRRRSWGPKFLRPTGKRD